MAPRNGILQIGRPVLLRPFTSVTAPAQDTKTPEFEFLVPQQQDGSIALDEVKWSSTRFVFVFLNQKLLADPETLEGKAQRFWLGDDSSGNPLVVVVQVGPDGEQSLCLGGQYRLALAQDRSPSFGSGKMELPSLEPQQVAGRIEGSYAVASPVLLPLETIDKLRENRPSGLPLLGTGMAVGVPVGASATPANPDWVFPVVDPLLITENLARKYYAACDNFLAASQNFDRPASETPEQAAAREQGQLLQLKRVIADNLVGLRQAAPNQGSVFDDTLRPGLPERFLEEYQETLTELAFQRELAAFTLIAWLETETYRLADDFWPRDGGKPGPTYDAYVRASLNGLARLAESDRGLKYLSEIGRRQENASSPVPSGVLHVTSEFLFRDSKSSGEQQAIAIKSSTSVFSVWSAFVAASVAGEQRLERSPNPTTTFAHDLETFAQYLEFVFHERILEVDVKNIPLKVARPRGDLLEVVDLPVLAFAIGKGAKDSLKKAKLVNDHVDRVCAVLNFGIAFQALRKTLEERGDQRAKTMTMADLAAASLGVVEKVAALPAFEAFRDKMANKLNTGGKLLGNRVASTLGLLGAIASLTNASLATIEEYERGDWDEAAAHFTESFGALLIAGGQALIFLSGTTGPFALWTIGVGTAATTAGFLWSVFAADTELDQMLKFCAFGKQSGEPAIEPPGWTQCEQSFAEWNPKTVDGLVRQLKAFQQVFYSFEAAGAFPVQLGPSASDGFLRITPSSLRLACSFEIEYMAVYQDFGSTSAATRKTLKGKVSVQIPSIIVEKFTLVDPSGNYETEDAVRPHREGGRDAFDVRFRLTKAVREKLGKTPELESLTCLVQLRVPGAGVENSGDPKGTLVVPMSTKGPKRVKVDTVKHGHADTSSTRSLEDQRLQ